MTSREADARPEVEEFESEVAFTQRPSDVVWYRHRDTGEALRDSQGQVKTFARAPQLTPQEQQDAANALTGALESGNARFPLLTQQLLRDPSKLWLMGEIQLMLNPQTDPRTAEASYDFTGELMEGLLDASDAQRDVYEFEVSHEETQQIFWNDIGKHYDPAAKELIISALAQLTPGGANRVAAQAIAWADNHDLTNPEELDQMFLNVANWSAMEQEHELGMRGFFNLLDAPQEFIERNVVAPAVNFGVGLLSGAEEAARRKDLTPGQQIAYQLGLRPPEGAGEFGWWTLVSGAADAQVEIGADPLNWLAGLGAGSKAIKAIPLAQKATKTGKALTAARALLPRFASGASRQVRGGRVARVTYALRGKSLDELLEQTVSNGTAQSAMNLIQTGRLAEFERLYPAWKGISGEAIETIASSVQRPEEFIEVLKADALNDVLNSGRQIDDLQRAARTTREAATRYLDDTRVNPVVDEILENPDDFVYHGSVMIDDVKATELLAGEDTFFRGGITSSLQRAEAYAPDAGVARPSGVDNFAQRLGRKVLVFRKSDLPEEAQRALQKGDIEEWQALWKNPENVKGASPVHIYDGGEGLRAAKTPTLNEILSNQNIPPKVRLEASKAQLSLDAFNMRARNPFILSEVPQRSKRIFSWDKVINMPGTGRLATGVRRTAARITMGRIPDEIELINTRQGMSDIRRLMEHFGVRTQTIDEVVDEFRGLEIGARQDFIWDTVMRRVGDETGVPAFQHNLIQFYKGAGVRNFSGSGADLIEVGGEMKRVPILASQISAKMPVPTEVLTQVFRRAQSIGNRSKLAKAMKLNGRGVWGGTKGTRTRRRNIVRSLRRELGDEAQDMTDEQLYNMAFSYVSPNPGMDGRGIIAGQLLPKAGSVFGNLHSWFTKSMLVFRPIQWMWRVALLEEPLRAHMFNMPSVYSNPLQYMARAREAHYIANVHKWADANMNWSQDAYRVLTQGDTNKIIESVRGLGVADEVFGADLPQNVSQARRAVAQWVEAAMYGRTRPTKLNPVKRVPWAVKNRARNIEKAEKALKKLGMPDEFDFATDAAEIAQRLVSGYLGEAVGASQRKLYQWAPALTNDEAYTHGRVWHGNVVQFQEDAFGRMALRRKAALIRGDDPDVTGQLLVSNSRWEIIAPDLRLRFPDVDDDVVLAERYLDEVLDREVEHLFRPFLDTMDADEAADMLDNLADNRQLIGRIGGHDVEWDMSGSNYAGAARDMGDFVASVRKDPTLTMPDNLPAVSFDPRFLAEDDAGYPSRMANWVLQTFGERATQTLNRRPAWLSEYNRHFRQLEALGVDRQVAQRLATDNANKMVNHVFFNMDEAPYYVSRLNKILPFFGATFEVVGTWAYKMPVAVGGTWPTGVGEFARKIDRIVDGLVNVGLLDRTEEDDGTTTLTLNLVPPDNDAAAEQGLGRMLQGAGFAAINTLDQAVSTLLGLEEGLELRSQGYRLAAGHPLNPSDYGILSFAQADVGLNPATNILVTALAGRIPGATGPKRDVAQPGESLAAVADRLDMDVNDVIRYNREVFVDTEDFGSTELYNGLLAGTVDPDSLTLPENTVLNIPGSSLWDAMSDTFMPFGEISSPHEFATNFLPGSMRWVLGGLALQNQPTDEFWKDSDLGGVFGGVLPNVNQAQVASQLNEAFMYLEAHDTVNDKGPFARIQEKEQRLQTLLDQGNTEEANALRAEITLDTEAFLNRAQKVAAESLILRGLTGQMLPTTPGHVRQEQEMIQRYWNTREYADSLKIGEGKTKLQNFKNMEEVEQYQEQLAAWLTDPTGDRARSVFAKNNPQLMAYLTPKTFYKDPVPDIHSYEEYQRQIESGEREPSPLHVTMWRARSASIQADYYNKYIATFGNDPVQAAATALNNRQEYNELSDERNLAYQALEMWDDMHGGVYDNWRTENFEDVETWAQDQINEKLNTIRDNLGYLLEIGDDLDIELDLNGVANLNGAVRGAIAEVSNAIREYDELTEDTQTRNAYEAAIHRYFQEVYVPYAEQISELYDQLPEVADSERESLIYERIKFIKNQFANTTATFPENPNAPFPNPLEFSWQGKDEDEQNIKRQQWITRPVEWMDQDQAIRLTEVAPNMAQYLPTAEEDFDIYRQFTTAKIQVDEQFEANEITRSERNKIMKSLDEQLRSALISMNRAGEVLIMEMTPYEKLELSELLPPNLGIYGDHVRYYKEVLKAQEESPGTELGRQIVQPLYDLVERDFYSDTNMRTTLQELGINLQDETALDSFLPWLFFGHGSER